MAIKKLTNAEKWSVGLSLLAILVSVISPVISYYWFDPQLQSFRNRARLQITSSNPITITKGETKPKIEVSEIPLNWNLELINLGKLPANDTQIVVNFSSLQDEKLEPIITFDPPILTETKVDKKTIFLTLKKAIAPEEKIRIQIDQIPDDVWVYSEFGEVNTLQTNIKFIRDFERTLKLWSEPINVPK